MISQLSVMDISRYISSVTNDEHRSYITIICDLDGTLIHTDRANWYAYRDALYAYDRDLNQYKIKDRITRSSLRTSGILNGLSLEDIEKLVCEKQKNFAKYVCKTFPEIHVVSLIKTLYNAGYHLILATSAEKIRADLLLDTLGIASLFQNKVYKETLPKEEDNKYRFILQNYSCNPNNTFVIENEYCEQKKALLCGIPVQNLLCKEYRLPISENEFSGNTILKHKVEAYYQMDYVRWGTPNNPSFINELKNQDGKTPQSSLLQSATELKTILYGDLLQIYVGNRLESLTICVIPRAKKEEYYQEQQKMFRSSIAEVISLLNNNECHIEDGTKYILRHKDTPTTHLGETDCNGRKTYEGITQDTCKINPRIANKDILLIDDIYTKNVNIDEDAIQTLYQNGANKVIFYSVARTPLIL